MKCNECPAKKGLEDIRRCIRAQEECRDAGCHEPDANVVAWIGVEVDCALSSDAAADAPDAADLMDNPKTLQEALDEIARLRAGVKSAADKAADRVSCESARDLFDLADNIEVDLRALLAGEKEGGR